MNSMDAKYFVNEVYRLNKSKYFELRKSFTTNSNLLPDREEIESFGNADVGELVCKKVFEKFDGADNSGRRNTLFTIKTKFKIAYSDLSGLPKTSSSLASLTRFKMVVGKKYEKSILAINSKERGAIVALCYHSLSHLQSVIWIDASNCSAVSDLLTKIAGKINFIAKQENALFESIEDAIRYRNKNNLTYVFDNIHEDVYSALHERISNEFNNNSDESEQSKIIFIMAEQMTDDGSENKPDAAAKIKNNSHYAEPRSALKKSFTFTLFIILFLASAYLIYASFFQRKLNLELLFFSDEVFADDYVGGVNQTWQNADGEVLSREIVDVDMSSFSARIPFKAATLTFSVGPFEIVPDKISIDELSTDELKIYFIQKISRYDEYSTRIDKIGAQRWFVFELSETDSVKFCVSATDGKFKPQTAIYADLTGKYRLSRSKNYYGISLTDSTSTLLTPGKYYVKVRGYDESTGEFKFAWRD